MIKRFSLGFCLVVALLALAASPAAAECYDECTPSSSCAQECVICTQEHWEFGCVRWAYLTCGHYGWCSGGTLASSAELLADGFPEAPPGPARVLAGCGKIPVGAALVAALSPLL